MGDRRATIPMISAANVTENATTQAPVTRGAPFDGAPCYVGQPRYDDSLSGALGLHVVLYEPLCASPSV
jgi:hypothetical protein